MMHFHMRFSCYNINIYVYHYKNVCFTFLSSISCHLQQIQNKMFQEQTWDILLHNCVICVYFHSIRQLRMKNNNHTEAMEYFQRAHAHRSGSPGILEQTLQVTCKRQASPQFLFAWGCGGMCGPCGPDGGGDSPLTYSLIPVDDSRCFCWWTTSLNERISATGIRPTAALMEEITHITYPHHITLICSACITK